MAKIAEIDYSKFTEQQMKTLHYYLDNNMKRLKTICHSIWMNKGISMEMYDDLYSDAMNVLSESIVSFDEDKEVKFSTYLTNNIKLSYKDWYRDNFLRSKRNNLELDEHGKIKKDERGNPIFINNVSFDNDLKEGISLKENITIDKEEADDENLMEYLEALTEKEKQIATMVMEGYQLYEIKNILHISDKQFGRHLASMRDFNKHRILKKNNCIVKEEKVMSASYTQTLEKSKPDRLSIASIIKKIDNYTIRFDHPLQRFSEQWSNIMKGNLISDILQRNPIPSLVFAEQIINSIAIIWDLDGKQRCTVAYSFSRGKFKISRNIRRWLIPYQAIIKDENGKIIFDKNGFPQTEHREFDIRGKSYFELPEELQERFMDYNFEIVQYLNCSAEDIAYHIARYNEGRPMNKQQKGNIHLGENFASLVKGIAAMPFFKEIGKYTVKESNNDAISRVVVESIVNINFLEKWKKDYSKMCEFLKDNAKEEHFEYFEDMVNRLTEVIDDKSAELFTASDSFLWFGLFARFIDTGEDDKKFVEFMAEFTQSLHNKKVNGKSYDDMSDTRRSKEKPYIIEKMDILTRLMNDFLNINSETVEAKTEVSEAIKNETVLDFVKENVTNEVTDEDIKNYEEDLEMLSLEVDNDSKLLDEENKKSLVALIAYTYLHDICLDSWFVEFFQRATSYKKNQKENYLYMINDLTKHIQKESVA